MADDFNPYYKWLAIPPEEQPPDRYRLLGVRRFETDAEVIATAADQRMAHLRTFQTGKYGPLSQQLLNEVAAARVCLLNPARKAAYDLQLRAEATPPAPFAAPAAPPPVQNSWDREVQQPIAPGLAAPSPVAPSAPFAGPGAAQNPVAPLDSVPVDVVSSGSRRVRKQQRSPLGLLAPLAAMGAVAVGLAVYLNSIRPTSSPLATQSAAHPDKPALVQPAEQPTKEAPQTGAPAGGQAATRPAGGHRHGFTDNLPDEAEAEPKGPAPHAERPESSSAKRPAPDEPPGPAQPVAHTPPPAEMEARLATAGRLLEQVSAHISAGTVEQSPAAGGDAGAVFEEIPVDGALLVGLNVAMGDVAGRTVLRGLQAIYLTRQGMVLGDAHGSLDNRPVRLLAKPGYAVGALKVRAGARIDALALVFMRIDDDRLDPDEAYESPWIGGEGNAAAAELLTGDGRAAVGLFGGWDAQFERIGLMLDEAPDWPQEPMPTGAHPEPRALASRPLEPPPTKRLPVPSPAAQKEAQTLIRTLFKEDYLAAAKGPKQKKALAEKLFHKGEETGDDPAARYVLVTEARDLAVKYGDSLAVGETILLLANHYDIDDVSMTLDAFDKVAEVANPPVEYRRKLVENCILLIDRAVKQEKYEVADQLIGIGRRASAKAQDSILAQRLASRAARLREQRAAYDAVRGPIEALAKDPHDPAANLEVGRYRCFQQEDWSAGLPLLAQGSDAALASVARAELASRIDAEQQLKLAEAWDALGKSDDRQRAACQRRARFWYARAVPGLRGISKAKVEKRLGELEAGRGLKAEYFRGENLLSGDRILTRTDPNIDFQWDKSAPAADLPADNFSVRWTGLIAAPIKGDYQLIIDHDDGVRVWVDTKLVIDASRDAGNHRVQIQFAAKPRGLKVEFVERGGQAHCILKWSQKGGFSEQVVPPEAFWQEHAAGSKTFAPLPLPDYRADSAHADAPEAMEETEIPPLDVGQPKAARPKAAE